MSRVNIHRSLPPLYEALGPLGSLKQGKSNQQAIFEALFEVANRLRSSHSKPFYSIRELATFFKVPLTTISRVYQRLEREHVLCRIRSSHTVLMGIEPVSRQSVRGVVGLYVWAEAMAQMAYTRNFVIQFEEKLRNAGFVADIIFHEHKKDELHPEFSSRLAQHHLDAVVLHTPLRGARQNILSLRERGIRVLVIQRKDKQVSMPAAIYLNDYSPGYTEMANAWHQSGIKKAKIWIDPDNKLTGPEVGTISSILNQRGIQVEALYSDPAHMLKITSRGKAQQTHEVVFLESFFAQEICNREPQIIEQISRRARLGFCAGPIRSPYLRHRSIRADVIEFRPAEAVSVLTNDICRMPILSDGVYDTFPAYFHEQRLI